MEEYKIEQGAVATIGDMRVAVAKIWQSGGALNAWLSIVKKGSNEGQKDIDVKKGDLIKIGERNFSVIEISEEYVHIIEKK